jgi:hypothetical protein
LANGFAKPVRVVHSKRLGLLDNPELVPLSQLTDGQFSRQHYRDPNFTNNFWQEIFKLQGTNCISKQLIIPRLMVKLNFSTSVWKHI